MAKRVTLKEVAAQAGVSYQTVSKVLNRQVQVSKETEKRILKAVQSLGYQPNQIARSLRSQHSYLIGYSWAPAPPNEANSILDRFLQSMAQTAQSYGYFLLTFPSGSGKSDVDGYRDLIDTNRVDGFVISSVEFDDPRLVFLQKRNFPCVAFGRSNPNWDFAYVDIDGEAGMHMVAQHLLDFGHRRFAILAWPESSRVGQNRMAGLLPTLQAAGVQVPPDWLVRGEGSHDFGWQTARRLLDVPADRRPTALVCFNDLMAIGALNAARALGLNVPGDISITGFEDVPMTLYLDPPLTTVHQPIWEVGEEVVNMLLPMLQGEEPQDSQILLPPRLVPRASSGPVP